MTDDNLFGQETFNGVPTGDIDHVFSYWKETFGKRSSTVLDEARKKKIATAIKNYGIDTCEKAIRGCSMSPWHTGQNPGSKQYTDLTLIFRNADKVEMFVGIFEQESRATTEMEEWLND